ncbi:MAG: hypothetical protein WCH57_02700 [Verrucomicrobiota bacterium]
MRKIRIPTSAKSARDLEEISVRTGSPKSEIGAAALKFALPKIFSGEIKIPVGKHPGNAARLVENQLKESK